MNDRQREILKYLLTNEKGTLKKLQVAYEQASRDCASKIADLSAREDLENIESIVYQKKYQQTIKNQIDEVLNTLRSGSFDVVNNHINDCYENGFIGAMYDLHGQKIPIISPIDLNLVVKAIQHDTKLSGGLYKRMGEDIQKLKKDVTVQVSAGIAGGSTWNEMADKIAVGMNSPFKKAKNIAMRIAVTEGHRVQNQGALDAGIKAKSKGAEIVKQWDATLDGRTRPSHARVDGEIVELEDSFSNGLSMPGDPKGHPKEVVRCRCALLQRAKWGLDGKELKTLEDRAKYFGLDKSDNFEDYKSRYLKASGAMSGAISDKEDRSGEKRRNVAKTLYAETLNRKREYEIKAVAKNTGFTEEEIDRVFSHIYERQHYFETTGEIQRFYPDYYMALSWQRLRNNDNIQPHDLTMLKHELLEESIMGNSLDIPYETAHNIAEKQYNYQKELMEYLEERGLL